MLKQLLADIRLDVATLKSRLADASSWRERLAIYAALGLRALAIVTFAVVLVAGFTVFIGDDNAPVGVVTLLALLTFQKVHLGYDIRHATVALVGIFALFAVLPPLVNLLAPWPSFLLNMAAIFLIVLFGCDKIEYYNHAILVLSYLLLLGNPAATAHGILLRMAGLAVGGIWAASLMYRHHRDYRDGRGFIDVIRDFSPTSSGGVWKIQLAFTVSLGMLIGELLGLNRPMWIGIATMSILTPFTATRRQKARERITGTIIGSLVFFALLQVIPSNYTLYMGLIAGVCLGFSTSYTYQSVFNAFGALGIAVSLFGTEASVLERVEDNLLGIVLALVVTAACDYAYAKIAGIVRRRRNANEDDGAAGPTLGAGHL